MKTAKETQIIRQGDVLLIPVDRPNAEIQSNRVGIRIAGERTGHSHQLVGSVALHEGREYVLGGNVLTHQEHEHIATARTWYEVRTQREHVPQDAPVARWD